MEILVFIFLAVILVLLFKIGKKVDRLLNALEKPTFGQSTSPVKGTPPAPTAQQTPTEQAVPAPTPETAPWQPPQAETFVPNSVQDGHLIPKVANQTTYSPQNSQVGAESETYNKFVEWLKKDWLAKFGALFLLIGFGWFVSFAFAEGWVGPQGRIAIGLVAGAFVLAFGYYWIRKHSHQGSIFLVLGSTIILLTMWSARAMYDFFTPASALVIMFLAVAFVTYVAVVQNNSRLATVSLLLALGAPLLTNSPEPSLGGLFSYVLVVILGAVWVVSKTGWRYMLVISLATLFLYSLPFLGNVPRADAGLALLYSFVFTAIFVVVTLLTLLKQNDTPSKADLFTIAGTGLYLLAWISAAAPAQWESMLYATWSVVFTSVGYGVYRLTQKAEPFYLYAGVGIVYFVLATVATFEGPILIVALTIEAALVPALAYAITQNQKLLKLLSLLLIIPGLLSLPSIASNSWNNFVPLNELSVLLAMFVALVGLGSFMYKVAKRCNNAELETFAKTHVIIGCLYFLVLVWLIPQGTFSPNYDLGRLVSLIIYTILGIGTYIIGHVSGEKSMRIVGGILVGGVIARLLLVEVWEMEMGLRITTFFIVGLLFIATAFIERKKTE